MVRVLADEFNQHQIISHQQAARRHLPELADVVIAHMICADQNKVRQNQIEHKFMQSFICPIM